MGPSGSGKSTFMNLLGLLDTASEGSYQLEGQEVSSLDRNELAKIRNKKLGHGLFLAVFPPSLATPFLTGHLDM